MTWVTWRQHRGEFWIAVIVFILILPVVLITRNILYSIYLQGNLQDLVYRYNSTYYPLITLFELLPLLLSVFVGAPFIARELESHTHHLAWTQSIPRARWLAVKLAWVGGASAAAFLLLALLLTYWSQPIQLGLGPWITFDITGSAYAAYAVFALALGIFLGTLLGKTLPAMVAAIPVFGLARWVVLLIRPYYLPLIHATWNLTGTDPSARAWVINQFIVDSAGQFVKQPVSCGSGPAAKEVSQACLRQLGYQISLFYQPANRFWTFQAIETMIFLTLTAGLIALTFWWIKHRVH